VHANFPENQEASQSNLNEVYKKIGSSKKEKRIA